MNKIYMLHDGEYKILTLLFNENEENFLSEINIHIVENTMSLVSGQSITYTRENTPQVINVNFTDIIIPEQIKEVSLSGSLFLSLANNFASGIYAYLIKNITSQILTLPKFYNNSYDFNNSYFI